MRRLSISILAGLLLVGLVAAPAAADRDIENGNIPHYSFVYLAGTDFGAPEVRELPTGEWADVAAGWATATADHRQHFLDTVIVDLECDGVSQDATPELRVNEYGGYIASYGVLLHPGKANSSQTCMLRWEFTEDHCDGYEDLDGVPFMVPAGTIIEVTRTVVWTPRGQFPSGDYPPSNF